MRCQPWAKVVISTEGLDDSWRKELLGELCKLKTAVWGEWAGFDDDAIPGQKGRGNFPASFALSVSIRMA
jgi:hypothetical protein